MGGANIRQESIIRYVGQEEGKGETRVFRSAELKEGEPIHDKLPGDVDTLLKCFE